MTSVNFSTDDAYVDVDEIFSRYHRSKSKIFLLICSIVLIFIGTIGGFWMLQRSAATLDVATESTLEFAEIAVASEFCLENPGDSSCIKASAMVANPEKYINPGVDVSPKDPANIFALFMQK